jgi:hypothetical protein
MSYATGNESERIVDDHLETGASTEQTSGMASAVRRRGHVDPRLGMPAQASVWHTTGGDDVGDLVYLGGAIAGSRRRRVAARHAADV